MKHEKQLKEFARLVVKVGVNLQKGQELVVNTPIECADFARLIAEAAYQNGASLVTMMYSDEKFLKLKYQNTAPELLEQIPSYVAEARNSIADRKAAYVVIASEDPEIFADVDPDAVTKASRALRAACSRFYDASMSNAIRWCVISAPCVGWAKKLFPDLSDEEALEKLWQLIFKTMRLDTPDAVKAWEEHQSNLERRVKILNEANLKTLTYRNSLGTNFSIGLPEKYVFIGGAERALDGVKFTANMPTEEIFTAPDLRTANGTLVSSMPLCHNGNLIVDFKLRFENGRIVEYSAAQGFDTLKNIIETDEGAHFLGEIALVQHDSTISNLNTLFYNTLFDENASCHFAIGKAYPCVSDAETLTKEEMKARGLNQSIEHVDFMVGTKDLSVIGTKENGEELVILKDGNFAF